MTVTWRSGEYQFSETTSIGLRLPISPAGIVHVVDLPSAFTPSKSRMPRFAVRPLPSFAVLSKRIDWMPGKGGICGNGGNGGRGDESAPSGGVGGVGGVGGMGGIGGSGGISPPRITCTRTSSRLE